MQKQLGELLCDLHNASGCCKGPGCYGAHSYGPAIRTGEIYSDFFIDSLKNGEIKRTIRYTLTDKF